MDKYKMQSKALRMTFIMVGLVIWLGIALTGFGVVHWLLYIPAVALVLAGASGICPNLIVTKLIFKEI